MDFVHNANQIAVYSPEGKTIAEVTFPGDSTVDINHTFVDDSLRGQGVAGKLMQELVSDLRATNRKATLTCSYAISWFEKHPDCGDILK